VEEAATVLQVLALMVEVMEEQLTETAHLQLQILVAVVVVLVFVTRTEHLVAQEGLEL
jgi:hypothetical protein